MTVESLFIILKTLEYMPQVAFTILITISAKTLQLSQGNKHRMQIASRKSQLETFQSNQNM